MIKSLWQRYAPVLWQQYGYFNMPKWSQFSGIFENQLININKQDRDIKLWHHYIVYFDIEPPVYSSDCSRILLASFPAKFPTFFLTSQGILLWNFKK